MIKLVLGRLFAKKILVDLLFTFRESVWAKSEDFMVHSGSHCLPLILSRGRNAMILSS